MLLKEIEHYIDVKQLAEIHNCEPRTIQLWVQNEGAPREDRGQYPLFEFTLWRLNKLKNENEILRSSGDEKLHALKMEGQRISNQEKKLKLRRLLGELVEVAAVNIAWLSEVKYFDKALEALKNKLTNSLENITDNIKQREIINNTVNDVKLSIAKDLKIEDETDTDELIKELEDENTDSNS